MPENEMPPGGTEAAQNISEALPESMTAWVQQRRAQTPPPQPLDTKSQPHSPARRRFRTLLICLAFLSCGWFMYANSRGSSITAIQGRLEDPRHRPIAGARVFLESNPTFETVTDRNGTFRLSEMPLGRQVLVAAQDDAGEEYSVVVAGGTIIDVGGLVYHVPPQSVRRAPGGGYGWTGLTVKKP